MSSSLKFIFYNELFTAWLKILQLIQKCLMAHFDISSW